MRPPLLGVALLAIAIPSLYGGGDAYAAERSPWYIGAGVGRSSFSVNASQLQSAVSPPLPDGGIFLGTREVTLDSDATNFKVYGGFQINRYFGVEAGYTDFGKVKFEVRDIPPPCFASFCPTVIFFGPTTGEISAEGWNLSAVGTLPLTERFELSGRLGAFRSRVKLRASREQFIVDPVSSIENTNTVHRTRPLFGAEIRYRITPEFSFTLGWERIDNLGSAEKTGDIDVKFWSLGVRYDF